MNKFRRRLERTYNYEMTEEVRSKLDSALNNPDLDDSDLKKVWQELRMHRNIVVPREELEWFPTIDYEKCTSCKICLNFCSKKVYEIDEDSERPEVRVKNPYNCVFICSHCSTLCPEKAISFPDKKEFYKYIKYF